MGAEGPVASHLSGGSDSHARALLPHPLMIAWVAWQESDDGKRAGRLAGESNRGNLWAAFLAGWRAAGGTVTS